MNVVIGKTNPCALSVFALLLSLLTATVPQVDGAEETAAPEPAVCVEAPTANVAKNPEAEDKTGGPVYLFHLAQFPNFGGNSVHLHGSGDNCPHLESLFYFGILGWELNIWRADHVTPGKYEFEAGLGHEGLGPEWYECKPVTVSQVPCVFWDFARFVPIPVTCEVDLPEKDEGLLFGYMVTEKADAGNKPRCHLFPGHTAESENREDLLWLNEEITNLRFRFVYFGKRYGIVAGKELLLGDAKSLRGKKIRVSVQYDDDEDARSRQKEVEILQMRIPVSNAVQCTVTITSPNGESRVLR